MSLFAISLLANDQDFMMRSVSSAAVQEIPDPFSWATSRRFEIAAAPGFGDAYQSALDAIPPVERPGRDQAVISDGQIASAVAVIRDREGQG